MADIKTKPGVRRFESYLETVDEKRREDCRALAELMQKITGESPVMWGPAIVGFGQYHYRYASGREGDMCITGFSARKADLTVYLAPGYAKWQDLMTDLGKHRTSLACLHVKRLADVNMAALEGLIRRSIDLTRAQYPEPETRDFDARR